MRLIGLIAIVVFCVLAAPSLHIGIALVLLSGLGALAWALASDCSARCSRR